MVYTIYRILRGILITFIPIILVAFSISVNLTNSALHKNTLKSGGFYSELSERLQTYDPGFNQSDAYYRLVLSSVITELATPGWLQNITERNIDLTTAWLRGDVDEWEFYLPSQDVDLALGDQLDQQTADYIEKYGDSLTICTQEQALVLRNEGLDTNDDFCVPQSVNNKEQSLSDFFELGQSATTNQTLVETYLKNNFLSDNQETHSMEDVLNGNLADARTWITYGRDVFVFIQNYIIFFVIALAILAFGLVYFSRKVNKQPLDEARKILNFGGYSILIYSFSVILIVGGGSYVTSLANSAFIPDYDISEISTLIFFEFVKFGFNITSIAIYIATSFFVVSIILWFVKKSGIGKKARDRNPRLSRQSVNFNNPTFDGKFQRSQIDSKPPEEGKSGTLFSLFSKNNDTNFKEIKPENETRLPNQHNISNIQNQPPLQPFQNQSPQPYIRQNPQQFNSQPIRPQNNQPNPYTPTQNQRFGNDARPVNNINPATNNYQNIRQNNFTNNTPPQSTQPQVQTPPNFIPKSIPKPTAPRKPLPPINKAANQPHPDYSEIIKKKMIENQENNPGNIDLSDFI